MILLSILLTLIGGSGLFCYAAEGDWPPVREFPIVAIPLATAVLLMACSWRLSADRRWLRRLAISLCCVAAVYPGMLAIPTAVYVVWLSIQAFIFISKELVTWGHLDPDAMRAMRHFAGVFWFFVIYALVLAAAVRLFFQLISLRAKSPCASSRGTDVPPQQVQSNVE